MLRVGIIGAKAYTAGELIRILLNHPQVKITHLAARLEHPTDVAEFHPALRGRCKVQMVPIDLDQIAKDCDFVFLTMPHMAGAEYATAMLARDVKVADLSADFRFRNLETYEKTYGLEHIAPDLNATTPYGLPELFRETIKGQSLVAVPGCYVTSVLLALAPLMKQPWVKHNSIIADCQSGVSGAGRTPSDMVHYCEANESMTAYKVASHRHQPEIEENLTVIADRDVRVLFTPHLAPMHRGIHSTIYVSLKEEKTWNEIDTIFQDFYINETFVRLLPHSSYPRTKDVASTNFCDLGWAIDPRTNRLILLSVIDNLIKGASGQAVQVMNIMQGFEETAGLL